MSKPSCTHINVKNLEPSDVVKSIGVVLDQHLSMEQQISAICKSAHHQLFNTGRIRNYLNKKCTEQLVHAFITSKLDYCNSLLFGLPQKQINRLQRIQNIAARIVSLRKKHDHITPILIEPHWLPVTQRIKFKVLLR